MPIDMSKLPPHQRIIRELSDRIVAAQRPIRVLDALKWHPEVKEEFFRNKFKKLPNVDANYYAQNNLLPFNIEQQRQEFYDIERDVTKQLGQYNPAGKIMQRICHEYRWVLDLLQARGTPEFTKISQALYGSSDDAFYAGAPTLSNLATLLAETLPHLKDALNTEADEKRHSSEETVALLDERLSHYFTDPNQRVRVELSDDILADAAAGSERIKIRKDRRFSDRDLSILEVHEGWVHVATTLNGLSQPLCTFLSKGTPSALVIQEGLGIIMEIFTFSSGPARVARLTNRVLAIHMAEHGANFIEVFNFYRQQGLTDEEAYAYAVRAFRGSSPEMGPFTKDLAYSKGFITIYNYIRIAIQQGLLSRISLLFVGKTNLEDLSTLAELVNEGIVIPAKYLPPQFKDPAALSAWMCYSLFLNKLSLDRLTADFKQIMGN
ncbi:flavohemoglobin expression-modulating QEGLA motif protein [soil metagenome]